MCDASQELFLLEFLIDRVNVPSVQAINDDVLPVTTCVEFKILNLPPISISQDAAGENCTCLGDEPLAFRKGKSCLFALPARLLGEPICSFPIAVTVYKKLPPTVLPDVMSIGSCLIDTSDMLNSLLLCGNDDDDVEHRQGSPSRTLKNKFRVVTPTGQCVGEVGVFLRFSRLGSKVVTQFQNPRERKPYLFKGCADKAGPVFQCRRVSSRLLKTVAEGSCKPRHVEDRIQARTNCWGVERSERSRRGGSSSKKNRRNDGAIKTCCGGFDAGQQKESLYQQGEKTRQCGCEIKETNNFSCSTNK